MGLTPDGGKGCGLMVTNAGHYQHGSFNGLLLLALFALAAIGLVAVAGQVTVLNGSHAVAKHAADAVAIQTCLDNDGPSEVWKSRSPRMGNRYFQVCELPDGRLGFRIVELVRDGWREVTSFVVKDGTRAQLVEYLSAQAVRFAGKLSQVR